MAALGAAVAAPMIAATKSFGTAGSDLVQMPAAIRSPAELAVRK